MSEHTIYIDADSCPSQARNIVLKAGIRLNLPVVFVANREIPFSQQGGSFSMVVVEKKDGAADDYIVEHATEKDLVITRDIPLAQRLNQKQCTAINDRGTLFDQENIKRMLKQRELSMMCESLGLHSGNKISTYSANDVHKFASTLEKALALVMKK